MKKTNSLLAISALIMLSGFTMALAVKPDPFLAKGNKVKYEIINGSEKQYSTITIQSVTNNGSTTAIIGKEQIQNDAGKNTFQYRVAYYYDSLSWSVDPLNFINIDWKRSTGGEVKLVSDSLAVYPFRMNVNDTLLPASGYMRYNESASGHTEEHIILTGRRVTGKEDVTVGAEKFSAFRIESKMTKWIEIHSSSGVKTLAILPHDRIDWFVPEKGIVKMEWSGKWEKKKYAMAPAGK